MKKHFILLIFISSLFLSVNSQIGDPDQTPRECQIVYDDIPKPPVCEKVIGPDGQEENECYATGPIPHTETTNKNDSSFSESNFPLSSIDWSGYCNCSLLVYSRVNLKGYWLTYPFRFATDSRIAVRDILKINANSFNITCTF